MLIELFRGRLDLMSAITGILACLLVIFLILPLHEWAHGFAAYKLGDNTAKSSGRLTLNPLAHVDPIGGLCLLLFNFGWAKPVPVNFNNLRKKQLGTIIVAIAGPLANIVAGLVGAIIINIILFIDPYAIVDKSNVIYYILLFFIYYMQINAMLAVFNLIPIPPLDGSKILFSFLPTRIVIKIYQYQMVFFVAIYALLFTGILTGPITFLTGGLTNFMMWLTGLPFLPFK